MGERAAHPMLPAPSMGTPYPVDLELSTPPRFERIQLLLRLVILIAIGAAGMSMGWLSSMLYLLLPVFAAVAISSLGTEGYLARVGGPLGRVIGWVAAFYAYMLLVTDRFPTGAESTVVRLQIAPTGRPTIGSALLRWITSIPSAFVLAILGIVSGLLCFIAVVSILVSETEPAGIVRYQVGILRWQARLFAYHASLVQEYPPFALDMEQHHDELASSAA